MPGPELRKAAILLMSLPEEDAATLLAKLDQSAVEAVSIEIARLAAITQEEQTNTILEFAETGSRATVGGGGLNRAQELLQQALGDKASSALDNVRKSIEAMPFGFLHKVDSQNLLTILADEHPQTIALVLSHLPPVQSAEVIKGLPSDRQLSVVQRIATMGQTNPEIVDEVETAMKHRTASYLNQQFDNIGGVNSVAEMLNVTDRATERALLDNLAQEDPDLVEEIRRLMFVFEDMGKFSDKDIQTVLKHVETSQWAMALKGASEGLKQKVLGNMSARASELLQEEMDFLGAVRLSNVEQVQQEIVDMVRKLEDAGELVLNSDDDAEEFIS